MGDKIIKFLFSPSRKALVAARRYIGPAIIFRHEYNDWVQSSRDFAQLEGDSIYDGGDFDKITHDEAKKIYKDICPEEYLDKLELKYLKLGIPLSNL